MQGAGELIRRCAVLEKTALEIVQSSGVWGEAAQLDLPWQVELEKLGSKIVQYSRRLSH